MGLHYRHIQLRRLPAQAECPRDGGPTVFATEGVRRKASTPSPDGSPKRSARFRPAMRGLLLTCSSHKGATLPLAGHVPRRHIGAIDVSRVPFTPGGTPSICHYRDSNKGHPARRHAHAPRVLVPE